MVNIEQSAVGIMSDTQSTPEQTEIMTDTETLAMPHLMRRVKGGLWVTFEGPEACGKSTQIDLLERRLLNENTFVYRTKQPGGNNALSRLIRKGVLDNEYKKFINPISEIFMFYSDRRIVRYSEIYPVLDDDGIGLCDRENDSTKAYQCSGRGLPHEYADTLLRMMDPSGRKPDITILYDAPIEALAPRIIARKEKDATAVQESRFDDEALEFHRRVRAGFLDIVREEPERFVILNAMDTIEQLHEQTYCAVMERAARKGLYLR